MSSETPPSPSSTAAEDVAQLEEKSSTYEEKMLLAFVQKPNKLDFYRHAIQKMVVNDQVYFKWHWSWWALVATWAYLLYRKAYLASFAAFVISLLLPWGWFIYMIIMGGISPYFVVKRYVRLKSEIEMHYSQHADRIAAMEKVGGYHSWVVWAILLVNLMLLFFFTPMLASQHLF